jgi:hypothetical protein
VRIVLWDVLVDDSECLDDLDRGVGEQWKGDPCTVGKVGEKLDSVVADRRDPDTALGEVPLLLFQLDQLGLAVVSPVGGSIKEQQQTVGPAQILERPHRAGLIPGLESGNRFTNLGTGWDLGERVRRRNRNEQPKTEHHISDSSHVPPNTIPALEILPRG